MNAIQVLDIIEKSNISTQDKEGIALYVNEAIDALDTAARMVQYMEKQPIEGPQIPIYSETDLKNILKKIYWGDKPHD